MKCIIRRAQIENCIRCESRHATPRRFTHVCLSGANGRQFYEHVNVANPLVFVVGLEDWDAVPDAYKMPNGAPLNQFAGGSMEQVSAEEFAGRDRIEVFVPGWVEKWLNFTDREGKRCLGLKLDDETFIDAIDPAFVPFRSDTMQWSEVDERYKNDDGTPLVDPDEGVATELSKYAGE